MAECPDEPQESPRSIKTGSSSGSNSSSTGEEERLLRLFNSCDADGDGYLDGNDFIFMCQQLNMEESTHEIMNQLGMNTNSRLTFQDFIHFRTQVMSDLDACQFSEDPTIDLDTSGLGNQHTNVTSWPTMSSDSFGGLSGKPDSLDYDSGARDLSPEPTSLHQLMESHDPTTLKIVQEDTKSTDLLEVANRLHLAALTSLKGEIIEINNRLHRVISERDALEKQLNKLQTDKLRQQRDFEDRLEQTTGRYEERITELHSVIAELRKKIERHQINVIREEEEYEESDPGVQSTKSNNPRSIDDNNPSQAASVGDIVTNLNEELSRVVSELENAIDERKNSPEEGDEDENVDEIQQEVNDGVEEKALEACKLKDVFDFDPEPPEVPPRGLRPATFHPPPPPPPNEYPEPAYLQEEINSLKAETYILQEQIGKQEAELNLHRAALGSLREERDRYYRKWKETCNKVQTYDSSSPQQSRTSTPTKSQHSAQSGERSVHAEQAPVAKVAELKKLKTCASERQVLGPEMSSGAFPNTKVAEHLSHGLQECSNMQEIVQNIYTSGSELMDNHVSEFEIEFERLQSKIDNLKSQNDLLCLTLDESKAMTDRLTVLIGKYESNVTALQLAVNYSDQAMEVYDTLVNLVESEMAILATKSWKPEGEQEDNTVIKKAHEHRKMSESAARHLLQKLDRTTGVHLSVITQPFDTLSISYTTSSMDSDVSKIEESRLREYIHRLTTDRAAIRLTVADLESIHVDPPAMETRRDTQRFDLENAVLMQELMAIKEEKAELKSHNYLLEKEKRSIELRLSGKEAQEQAYFVQIEHLKGEVRDLEQRLTDRRRNQASDDQLSVSDISSDLTKDYNEALRREKKMKSRIQELVLALENLSRNSEIRHQQSTEFVNDLKRANSALISAFDKAKKKYQSKLKKLELQMQGLTERYETQIRLMKQKILMLEEECRKVPLSETSL
ncbi:colorectal mutant cancer protein-like isoform X4 [Mytilus galloprovincialis]|uniref:colorectal mutant cancer protein-like isoform X4 n=1 Tax=Mytilus galloprovincialis TaxID=29158 RepID=UPI003F7C3149